MKKILLLILIMPVILCACNNKKYVYDGKVTIEGEMVVAKNKELFFYLPKLFSEEIENADVASYSFIGKNTDKFVISEQVFDLITFKCVDTITDPVIIKEVEATINEKKYYARTDIVIKNDDDYNPMQPKFMEFETYGGARPLSLNDVYLPLNRMGAQLDTVTLKSVSVSSNDYEISKVYYKTGYMAQDSTQIEVTDYSNMNYKNLFETNIIVRLNVNKKDRVNIYGNIQFVVEYNNELYKINRPICLFCL